jgi:hypothetical protein
VIGFASGIDAGMAVKYADGLPLHERNPLACLILVYAGVHGLIAVKAMGLTVVLGMLAWLEKYCQKIALPAALGTASFQAFLIWYLLSK